jgi:hypothetical protein
MARFEAANLSSLVTATADAPLVAIRAPTTEVAKLLELGITINAATATLLGLTRATTVSVTPGTTKPGRNTIKGAPDSGTLLVSSWATAPVVSTNYLRQVILAAAQGSGIVWTWPADRPLHVGDGINISELVVTNLVAAAPSVFRYYAVWED